jgi:hypothetical protein
MKSPTTAAECVGAIVVGIAFFMLIAHGMGVLTHG